MLWQNGCMNALKYVFMTILQFYLCQSVVLHRPSLASCAPRNCEGNGCGERNTVQPWTLTHSPLTHSHTHTLTHSHSLSPPCGVYSCDPIVGNDCECFLDRNHLFVNCVRAPFVRRCVSHQSVLIRHLIRHLTSLLLSCTPIVTPSMRFVLW